MLKLLAQDVKNVSDIVLEEIFYMFKFYFTPSIFLSLDRKPNVSLIWILKKQFFPWHIHVL